MHEYEILMVNGNRFYTGGFDEIEGIHGALKRGWTIHGTYDYDTETYYEYLIRLDMVVSIGRLQREDD